MGHLWREDDHGEASVFQPEHLLREARRQRRLPAGAAPGIGVLDPDGDLVRHLRRTGRGRVAEGWACYHTEMVSWTLRDGTVAGVVGCAVGAPFAVLVAEQLAAWGCRRLVSVTSAGRIGEVGALPATILIEGALRDEGTSGHYLPPGAGAVVRAPDAGLLDRIAAELGTVRRGLTWTTDAPYRETARAIAAARARGAVAVEMEAAALYAFGQARGVGVACFAQVTNTMGQEEGEDFEKGEADGAVAALELVEAAARAFRRETVGA